MKKARFAGLAILLLLLIAGCSRPEQILKTGRYSMLGAPDPDWAYLDILPEQRFRFNRYIGTSYQPDGTWTLKNGELILRALDKEVYRFRVEDDGLIFRSGTTLVPTGAVFKRRAD